MSYIVSNCPAYLIEEDYCTCYLEVCSDCTDCIIKQVIRKCRRSLEVSYCPIEQEILQLFDIKEINK